MKRKNKILVTMKALTLAAAVAVMVVSPSCRKETVGDSAGNVADGVRVISVQFDNSTKATLSGVTPTFTNNDKIRVSNDDKSEERTISVDGSGNATFTTTLSGALTAIYPADAAVLSSDTDDAPIATSNNFKVLATQDGDVAKAIIAKATIAAGSSSATFTSQIALFEITPPSTAKKITVTSLKKVESGSRTGTAADINTENTGKTVITVGDGSADLPGTIYVALVPGVKLSDLSFDAGENIGLKGIPTSKLGTSPDETAAKTKYTIDGTNWHPYVEIGGKKWATTNIGATRVNDCGKFYSWGNLTGQSGDSFNPSFTNDNYNNTEGFKINNTDHIWDMTKHDAAYNELGGSWRLPTKDEFIALDKACGGDGSRGQSFTGDIASAVDEDGKVKQGKYWLEENQTALSSIDELKDITVAGLLYSDGGNYLFFLAAGSSDSDSLSNYGSTGIYWSSDLYTGNTQRAYSLGFTSSTSSKVNPQNDGIRYYGRSVRPVSD